MSSYQVVRAIPPLDVVRVLNGAGIRFVLVGSYGLAGWINKPRATEDVDVVVSARQVRKAVNVLRSAFPRLAEVGSPLGVRLRERENQTGYVDILEPVRQPLREVFRHKQAVGPEPHRHDIPSLEMAIVMKFAAMTSSDRDLAAKYQDAHDFVLTVEGNPGFDRGKLAKLGSLIGPDGGKDVVELARKVLAGERLNLL